MKTDWILDFLMILAFDVLHFVPIAAEMIVTRDPNFKMAIFAEPALSLVQIGLLGKFFVLVSVTISTIVHDLILFIPPLLAVLTSDRQFAIGQRHIHIFRVEKLGFG